MGLLQLLLGLTQILVVEEEETLGLGNVVVPSGCMGNQCVEVNVGW